MSRRYSDDVTGADLRFAAIVHLDPHPSREAVAQVGDPAGVGGGIGFTFSDQRQPGSKVPRPTFWPATFTTLGLALALERALSSGESKLCGSPTTALWLAPPFRDASESGRRALNRPVPITLHGMCRNIRTLHNFEPPATDDEIRAAALQYVRKVSGSTRPPRANTEAFDRAVDEVALATARLLGELVTAAPPRNRNLEAAKRRKRAAERFAA